MANYSKPNPFVLPSVIEQLKNNAPTKDLGVLRQVSTDYNTSMSKTYFDQWNKPIYIKTPNDFGMITNGKRLSCVNYGIKRLTSETWDPAMGHLFRKIRIHTYVTECSKMLNTYKPPVLKSNNLNIFEILPSCSTYITKLKWDFSNNCENFNEKL